MLFSALFDLVLGIEAGFGVKLGAGGGHLRFCPCHIQEWCHNGGRWQ